MKPLFCPHASFRNPVFYDVKLELQDFFFFYLKNYLLASEQHPLSSSKVNQSDKTHREF